MRNRLQSLVNVTFFFILQAETKIRNQLNRDKHPRKQHGALEFRKLGIVADVLRAS
jgi:hypothetical protein